MKIGYLTDIHMRIETPEGRTDNFRDSLLLKLEECGQIFNDNKCDVILCGGDWGDRPDIPYSAFNDLVKVLKSWKIPIVGIIGSHDYYGYELKSLKRTAVGALSTSGIVELVGINQNEYITLKDNSGVNIVVCGTPHTYYLDKDPKNYYKPRYLEESIQIQLTHGSLLDNPVIFEHVLIKDVVTESDIVLGAHYHPGWKKDFYNINNTFFVHPGSIARIDNTGIERIPRVLIINILDYGKYSFDFYYLKSAIKHPFKVKAEKNQFSVTSINNILDLIYDVKINVVDIKQQLYNIAKTLNYDNSVIEEAFNLIEEVENYKR